MRNIFSVFNLFFFFSSISLVLSIFISAASGAEDDLSVYFVNGKTTINTTLPTRPTIARRTQATTETVTRGTRRTSTVPVTTTEDSSGEKEDEDYVEDQLPLRLVSGVTTCQKSFPSECARLCKKLTVAFEIATADAFDMTIWILIISLTIMLISTAVCFVKWREMKKARHRMEINLSNLEKIRARNEKVQAEQMRQDAIDADPAKFPNKGNITIATNLDEALQQKCEEPNVIHLQNVEYDEKDNEQYDIGDEFDRFEGKSQKSKAIRKPVQVNGEQLG